MHDTHTMTGDVTAFYLLVVGHLLADFVLQRELAGKKRRFNNEMLLHSATAALLFVAPLILLSYPVGRVALATPILFLVHALIDAGKIEVEKKLKIEPNTTKFWTKIGIDQILHVTSIYILFSQLVV